MGNAAIRNISIAISVLPINTNNVDFTLKPAALVALYFFTEKITSVAVKMIFINK